MSWQELRIVVGGPEVPRVEALLRLAGAVAISLAGESEQELLEPPPGETPLWSSVALTALFAQGTSLDAVATILSSDLPGTAITSRDISDTDWEGSWARRPKTQHVGNQLLLTAADADIENNTRTLVRLNLGLAFGTGEHPSTRLCLEWLDAELQPGARMLDYGCGSGILAIAALQLGATYAWAVDVDRQALTATRENARLNEINDTLWIGKPKDLSPVQADLVMANILAGTLKDLTEVFYQSTKPGGRLVLSGILECQSEEVRRHCGHRFGPFVEKHSDGWILLSAPRREAPSCQ